MSARNSRIGLTRRTILRTGGASLLAAASVSSCDLLSTDPAGGSGSAADGADSQAKEAPMLAQRVAQGDLPPLQDRLPETPMIVQPVDRAGAYGGTWRSALLGSTDATWLGRTIGYEYLMRWNTDWTESIPNAAESVTASPDRREFTIALRKGLKWSDGQPMTADDLMFAWNDVLGNTELTPAPPTYMLSGDQPGTMEKVDERTVRVAFAKPSGLFTAYLAFSAGTLARYPLHYLKDFHTKYVEEQDLQQKVQEAEYETWVELFGARADIWANKDLPRLHPWILTTAYGTDGRVTAERNPYYFKVDAEGRQLPYIDNVVYDVINDAQTIVLKVSNGEVDFLTRHVNTPANKPVLASSRSQGKYHFFENISTLENEMIINLNLTHEDPVLREIFQNKDFRIGLSHAINREELIKVVFQAQAEPWQAAPRPETEFYDEEMAHQYLEYDTNAANEHLDKAGYGERDGDGFRLGPDGDRIHFSVAVPLALRDFWAEGMEMIVKYWKDVGVDARVQTQERSLFFTRLGANKQDATVWIGLAGGNFFGMALGPRGYLPMSTFGSKFGILWAQWFVSGGEQGEEPPEAPKKQLDLYRQMFQTPDIAEQKDLLREILQIYQEEFYTIGTLMSTGGYGIATDNFHNVPDMFEDAWYNTPAPTNPEQYYIS